MIDMHKYRIEDRYYAMPKNLDFDPNDEKTQIRTDELRIAKLDFWRDWQTNKLEILEIKKQMAADAKDEEKIKDVEEKYVKTYFSLMDTIKQIEYHKERLEKPGFGTWVILILIFGTMMAGVLYLQKK
jgi:hypothetical protein